MNVAVDVDICKKCTMNKVDGVSKIFGEIEGRPILILTQSPTHEENDAEELLVGPPGKFMWTALAQAGITREQCDVTAAVRCLPSEPVTGSYSTMLRPRAPSKVEIKQCSSYTKQLVHIAINGEKDAPLDEGVGTRAILILGQIAAKQLLGAEYKKDRRIIDSARLGVRVFCVDHPGFFLRAGIRGLNENDARLKSFRQTVAALGEFIGSDTKVLSAEEFLETRHYEMALTGEQAWMYARKLKKWSIERNERLSVDVEDDVPDDLSETGTEVGEDLMLTVAVCPKVGHSVMFVIDHPEHIPEERDEIVKALKWLLSDPKVSLTKHYGSTDAEKLKDILDIDTPGYTLDTFTGMYMKYPGRKKYGLDGLTDEFAPAFAGYKYIIAPYLVPEGVEPPKAAAKRNETLYTWLKKTTQLHFKNIPLRVLKLYNNADADVAKMFEVDIRNSISLPLARIYTDMGHLVMRMERNGPLVDYRQIDVLKRVWPPQVQKAADRLKAIAMEGEDGDTKFNPNTPEDIGWLLWTKMKIPYPDKKAKKYDTQKETLLQIKEQYPIAGEVIAYRKLAKTMSTYIKGYEFCANVNAGHLRTKWWLTGTQTGRMSSGGSKEKIQGVVNLQNIQKNTHIRNILISDQRWREMHLFLKKRVQAGWSDDEIEAAAIEQFGEMEVFLEFDQGQVEVRVAAQLSGDKQMIADCEAGDIHSQVGHAMTGWAIEKIKHDKETRTRTKNVHFGILFGLKPDGILKYIKGFDPNTKITLEEVTGYYNAYFARYPGMQVFIDKQHAFAELHGFVQTIFGMQRPIIINEQTKGLFDDYGQPAYWKNIAVNTPVQGSAHQLLMCGMVAMIRQPEKYALLGVPQMEVHDNLVMCVKLKNLMKCYWLSKELLEQEPLRTVEKDFPDVKWRVKLEVDGAAGFRFGVKAGLNNKSTIGHFLRNWYEENDKAIVDLKKLKAEAEAVVAAHAAA